MKNVMLKCVAFAALSAGFAFGASAATPIEYFEPVYKTLGDPKSGIDYWVTKTVSTYTVVTSDIQAWGTAGETSWYVITNDSCHIYGGVTCSGHVNLILCKGAELTISEAYGAGIATDPLGSFTIYGQPDGAGVLVAQANDGRAGIGGGYDAAGKNITINGGTITASAGSEEGAGIGGGSYAPGSNITINGGTVTATGGYDGAGIGGGSYDSDHLAKGENITINGGTVVATGGEYASGIGGASGAAGTGITINGGTVTATGGQYGSGIGGGAFCAAGSTVTIKGGNVTATGGENGSGIGRSYNSGATSVFVANSVTLKADGTNPPTTVIPHESVTTDVTASLYNKRYATAVAVPVEYLEPVYVGGVATNGIDRWITKTVSDYTVVTSCAARTTWDAGWYVVNSDVTMMFGVQVSGDVKLVLVDGAKLSIRWDGYTRFDERASITVSGDGNSFTVYGQKAGTGTLDIETTSEGAGIGGDYECPGGKTIINGGTVTVRNMEEESSESAGIGAGRYHGGADVTINGGTITVDRGEGYGAAAIGGAAGEDNARITINGGTVVALGNEWGAGIGAADAGSTDVTINGGTITTTGGECASGIGGAPSAGARNITINGGTITAAGGPSDGYYPAGSGIGGSTVYVADCQAVKSDNNNPPTTPVLHASPTTNIASPLYGKLYATVKKLEFVTTSPTEEANASTMKVYTNDTVEVAGPPYVVKYGDMVKVTYTANSGYEFAGGATTWTTNVTASKEVLSVTIPESEKPAVKQVKIEYLEPVYVGNVASNGVAYWTTNSVSLSDVTVVGSSAGPVVWGASGATNWYVVTNANVQIKGSVTCAGHVNLILCEGAKLVVTNVMMTRAGIATDANGSFTIYGQPEGTGSLEVTGGYAAAGIGGGHEGVGSNITINGGEVTATGGSYGAGIGGGTDSYARDIVINGGTVAAMGGEAGAGIGGGDNGDFHSTSSRIFINGGKVTAIGGLRGAGIGGGEGGSGSNIVIRSGAVRVANLTKRGIVDECGESIGNGNQLPREDTSGIVVLPGAKVFFNLTGINDSDGVVESMADMPEDFDGFVIMTPKKLTSSRTLVAGLSDWTAATTFTLTNTVTGATGSIDVNGSEATFASTYCSLTNVNGRLTLIPRPPVLTVSQQPTAANGYVIEATTDGNNGITNYAWMVKTTVETDFHALTNALYTDDEEYYMVKKPITGTCVESTDDNIVCLSWFPSGSPLEVEFPVIPLGGKLYFTCTANIELAIPDGQIGTLTPLGGNEWVWDPKFFSYYGYDMYVFAVASSGPFAIENMRWITEVYEKVAEGATMTAFPTASGVLGSMYMCQMTHGHEGSYYTGDSAEFTFNSIQVGADAWAHLRGDGTCTITGSGMVTDTAALKATGVTNLTVTAGVTGIAANMFGDWGSLRDVSLGADCTNIASQAFAYCDNLTNVTCAATASLTIGDHAFYRCNSLESLSFGVLPTLGEQAYTLQSGIYIKDGMPEIYPIPQISVTGYRMALMGSVDLQSWTEIKTEAEKLDYNFFKLKLEPSGK